MSILNVASRSSRRTSETADSVSTAPTTSTGLIEWSQPGEDLWVGKIHLDHAGMIELVGSRYVVTDWKNERIDTCDSLDEAKRVLEPSTRLSALEEADREAERQQWIASTAITLTLVIAASIGGWVITSI